MVVGRFWLVNNPVAGNQHPYAAVHIDADAYLGIGVVGDAAVVVADTDLPFVRPDYTAAC